MDWIIPGTTLTAKREDADHIEDQFRSMFLAGGIVLSQVSSITGLETHTVQNWVKRGFLTKPVNKHYSLRQLCRIININMLKSVVPMERICGLLTYINGHLDDESDDIIDDSELYFLFVDLALQARDLADPAALDKALEKSLENYQEPMPGARARVGQVLKIMLTGWMAAQLQQQTEALINQIRSE